MGLRKISQKTLQDYRVKILRDGTGLVYFCCDIDMNYYNAKVVKLDDGRVVTQTIPR